MKLVHGGDITGYKQIYGKEPLDFSANVSPLGMPQGIKQAIIESLDTADRYPDPLSRELRKAIAKHDDIDENYVICGNGAADLIFRLVMARKPKTALLIAPTFAEYEQALNTVDCKIDYYILQKENSFYIEENIIEKINSNLDMVFICQPNNPTGQICKRELMLKILDRCTEYGTILVVDECFVDFIDEPEKYTLKDKIFDNENLFILKAFTKLYAMAGVRLGYAFSSSKNLINDMYSVGQPWSVSSFAQSAGISALHEKEYVKNLCSLIKIEKEWLKKQLQSLNISVIGCRANFIFFSTDIMNFGTKMKEQGVMVRSCANYRGLDERYYRIAIRTHKENEMLIHAIEKVGGNNNV